MNKERRDRLAKAVGLLNQATAIIEECRDEEQEYYDNMPESLQGGDKGAKAEEVISALEQALFSVEDAVAEIENAKD
jgi:hypothetical protein